MIKVSTTGMAVSLKTDLRFPISGQWGHGDRIIHADDAIDVKSRIAEPSGLVIPAVFIIRATT